MKPIKDYEDYLIYEDGRVFSTKTNKFISNYVNTRGYVVVELFKNSKKKMIFLHRLIALNYIPNPHNKPCVNHINADKTDYRICNLEWATHSENNQHAYDIGLHEYHKELSSKLFSKSVINTETRTIYKSLKDASESTDIKYKTLSSMLNGQNPNKTKFKYL